MKIKILNHWLILLLLISWTQVKAQNYKTIKLEVNQEQVDLTITPVADALIEDLETVDFRLEESQDYLVSGIRSAQIGLFDAPAPPDITGFAPVQVNPGMNLLIRGLGFVGVTTVSFNVVLAEFTVDSPNQITAVVPPKAGSGPIAVGTPAGAAASSTELQVIKDAFIWTRFWGLQINCTKAEYGQTEVPSPSWVWALFDGHINHRACPMIAVDRAMSSGSYLGLALATRCERWTGPEHAQRESGRTALRLLRTRQKPVSLTRSAMHFDL
jgi:hypothetical protein